MTKDDKIKIYNLLKAASDNLCGYSSPDFAGEMPEFCGDFPSTTSFDPAQLKAQGTLSTTSFDSAQLRAQGTLSTGKSGSEQ